MNLYLVRHGETQANCDGVYCGVSDVPLTARGRRQAAQVARQLAGVRFDRVLASGLRRTQETAQILCPDSPPECRPIWNEMDFGEWELRHHRDLRREDAIRYRAWCDDWQQTVPPGGESFPAFSRRVAGAAGELARENPAGTLLLVGHQGVLSLLLAVLLGLPPAGMWHFTFRQDAYSRLRFADGFCVVTCLNDGGRQPDR
ncbi:alpha-ribazole phosphatase [Martelella alba]|uniref:Alpha-ribazole phosphatase n=1 Tax=Martelella alba TaxID=2590451 RepID=A0ABY2SPK8_9HYPH|nr:alpha-ribazole phosphatase [Martelella alba]TKI08027.1 alpha-ribazole phosphatase [Martelella alba]